MSNKLAGMDTTSLSPAGTTPTVQWRAAAPFLWLGVAAVIAGGLLSAAMAAETTRLLAWAVAYVVLIVGVFQIGFGLGQAWLATRPPSALLVAGQLVVYNLANAGVLAGTLGGRLWAVNAGGALLVLALALFFYGVRGSRHHRRWLWTYRILLLIILVSIPIGLLLAQR